MIYLFHGEDEFSLHEEMDALKARLDDDGMLSSNTSVLEGKRLKPAELVAVCATTPFLGGHRLIVVEGLLDRFEGSPGRGKRREGGGSRESAGPWKGLPEALAEMPESSVLVFVDGRLGTGNPLLRLLSPLGEARAFESIRQRAVPDWIRERAAKLALSISPRAVSLLADLVGNDLRLLSQEMDKLGVYAQGREITDEDVRSLVSGAREASILSMVDAVVEGRSETGVRMLQQLRGEGASSSLVLNMIARQYRHLILGKELMLAHLSPAEIGKRLGIRSEYALRKVLDQARRHSLPQLEAAFHSLLAADAAIKRGVYDEDLAVDILVHELAGLSTTSFSAV